MASSVEADSCFVMSEESMLSPGSYSETYLGHRITCRPVSLNDGVWDVQVTVEKDNLETLVADLDEGWDEAAEALKAGFAFGQEHVNGILPRS